MFQLSSWLHCILQTQNTSPGILRKDAQSQDAPGLIGFAASMSANVDMATTTCEKHSIRPFCYLLGIHAPSE